MPQWNPRVANTILDVRVNGPGNPWQILEFDAELAAPSGGGQPVDSRWGRGTNGQPEYRGLITTGNPERFTAQIMSRLRSESFLTELTKVRCTFDIRARQKCDDPNNPVNYTEAIIERDGAVTSRSYSGQLVNASTDQDEDIKSQYDASFGVEERMVKVRHDNISGTVADFALNMVRSIGIPTCNCVIDTGDQTFIAVSDADSTSGYAAIPTPVFYYTLDGGTNWTGVYIDVFPAGDAVDVLKAGDYILAASPTFGVAYARWQDILDGVAAPNLWRLSSGFTAPNGVNRFDVVNGTKVLAVGNGGRMWLSTDGGISFSVLAAASAVTSQNLNCVAWVNENLAWIGGASGVLVRYDNGSLAVVPVQTSAGAVLSSAIRSVAIPQRRGKELYIGTANGNIYKTTNSLANKVIFTIAAIDQSGTGEISDLQFGGLWGSVLFYIQTNASSNSRVVRDISGGSLQANQCEIIGSYTSPVNSKINSIGVADINTAITVGEKAGAQAFIGKVRGIISQ